MEWKHTDSPVKKIPGAAKNIEDHAHNHQGILISMENKTASVGETPFSEFGEYGVPLQ